LATPLNFSPVFSSLTSNLIALRRDRPRRHP
jgi:hypothetical protein